MRLLPDTFLLAAWALLWVGGGWLLAAGLFGLRRGEAAMVGVGLGLTLQIWLANAFGRILPITGAFWLAPTLVVVGGALAALHFRVRPEIKASVWHWIALVGLSCLFGAIGRGLAIFDDYQNLPTVSLMAAGDVPPHFALNPELTFGYHYALLLFSAEIMRVGNMFPWSALDFARGVSLALPLVLAAIWAYRITRQRTPALLAACLVAFAGGARWLFLLLPPAWLNRLSGNVSLIGSAASSASSLAEAMVSDWKIDGAGPIPFPFAFHSGINQAYVMAHTGIAGSGILIVLLLLLTATRWRHWTAGIVQAVLFSLLALANEIAFLLLGFGALIVAGLWVRSHRSRRSLKSLALWLLVPTSALVLAIAQGGMLSEIAAGLARQAGVTTTYFDTAPMLVWPPAMVSAHLGQLSLLNPWQLAAGLVEIGPVVVVTPLLFAWGWKSLLLRRWVEASLIYGSLGAVLAVFTAFRGPLYTATPRLMSGWFFVCALYAVPLSWIALRRRGDQWTAGAIVIGLVGSLGGIVLFGVQLAAIQRPVLSTFIAPLDAKMSQQYWNKLELGARIFDPVVFRAPTVFGRFTLSSPSWYTRYPAWEALRDSPDPHAIYSAGFEYVYFDRTYWEGLSSTQQSALAAPCVHQVIQLDGFREEEDYSKDFRRLLDVGDCK